MKGLSCFLDLRKMSVFLQDENGACSTNCSYVKVHNFYQTFCSGYERHWKTFGFVLCFFFIICLFFGLCFCFICFIFMLRRVWFYTVIKQISCAWKMKAEHAKKAVKISVLIGFHGKFVIFLVSIMKIWIVNVNLEGQISFSILMSYKCNGGVGLLPAYIRDEIWPRIWWKIILNIIYPTAGT